MQLRANCRELSVVWIWIGTFGLAVPLMVVTLQLCHSPYYQLYIWLLHHTPTWIIDDLEAASDGRLLGLMIDTNDLRVRQARSFLENRPLGRKPEIERTSTSYGNVEGNVSFTGFRSPTVMVTLISSSRDVFVETGGFRFSPRYLVQNVARFLIEIDSRVKAAGNYNPRVEYRLSVCSVGDDVTPEEEYVAGLIPVFRRQAAAGENTADARHDRLAWRYEKEKRDYTYCLQETLRRGGCYLSGSTTYCLERADQLFVLLVEDDALPTDNVLAVIDRLVSAGHWSSRQEVESRDFAASIVNRPYYKLYHPDYLHGFISIELERIPQLVAFAAFFGTVLQVVCSSNMSSARRFHNCRLMWTMSCLYFALLALAIGRVHLDRWRSILSPYAHYTVPDNFCCTQALLYPARTAAEIVNRLRKLSCNETFHKDEALWSLRNDDIRGLLVQPNLFEHVGIFSGLRGGFVDPHLLMRG